MTAEPEMRLVPVNVRDLDALRYVLNRADEASRIRTIMSTFTLPERETTAERLERLYSSLKSAAPAPQEGEREAIARIIDPAAFLFSPDDLPKGNRAQFDALEKADRILARRPAAPDADKPEGEAVACVIAFREGKREPEFVSWNKLPLGEHRLYAHPPKPNARLSVAVEAGDVWWLSGDPENTFTDAERAFEEALEWAEDDQPEMPVALGRANYLPDVWAVQIDGKIRLFATRDDAATALRQIEGG